MDENLNLIEILKDCPKVTKLYSTIHGDVKFELIDEHKPHQIIVRIDDYHNGCFSSDGKMYSFYDGECILFPSREQRDWSKFKPKQPKFDPNTLNPFDKVLARNDREDWSCVLFSHIAKDEVTYPYACGYGTSEDAPEFYRYWED